MGDTPKPPGGQAPLPSGDPYSFLMRVPGGASYRVRMPQRLDACILKTRMPSCFSGWSLGASLRRARVSSNMFRKANVVSCRSRPFPTLAVKNFLTNSWPESRG